VPKQRRLGSALLPCYPPVGTNISQAWTLPRLHELRTDLRKHGQCNESEVLQNLNNTRNLSQSKVLADHANYSWQQRCTEHALLLITGYTENDTVIKE
jgi:hypothetical protein